MIKSNFLKKTSVRWVVALKEEAEVILDNYKMVLVNEKTLYPIYKNVEETHWLTLSGIGRHNSAASTSYLYTISKASKWTSWINVGIAGSGKGDYGNIYLVDKIFNQNANITYPATMPKSNLSKMTLLTTDIPITDYSSKELIDMEGSAFFDIASKLTTKEFICIMKIVSDGPSNDIKQLNKLKIIQLVKSNLSKISKVISYYEKLSENENQIRAKPDIFYKISSNWHFSVTQRTQLDNLLRRLRVFCGNDDIMELIKQCENSSFVINALNNKIKSNKVDWSDV